MIKNKVMTVNLKKLIKYDTHFILDISLKLKIVETKAKSPIQVSYLFKKSTSSKTFFKMLGAIIVKLTIPL